MGFEVSTSFVAFLVALIDLVAAVTFALVPWIPLFVWIAFWLFTVDWKKLVPVMNRGGMLGVFLASGLTVLIWSSISVPHDNVHSLFGLQVSNWVGKTVYVSSLLAIAFLCGSVQLTGIGRSWIDQPSSPNQ